MYLMQLNPIFANSEPLKTPGTYYVRLYFNSDRTVQAQVSFTVKAYVVPPFPLINAVSNPNGMLLGIMQVHAVGRGSILAGGSGSGEAVTCLVVKGTIGVTTAWQGPASTPSPPQHTTMQYYVVGGDGTYHPLGRPVYSDTNPTVSSFDTTTLPDGSYIIWAKIIDMNDVSHSDLGGRWTTTLIGIIPQPIVIYNGSTPMNPKGTYTLPVSYYGNNFRPASTTPDFLRYQGLPAEARDYPYPSAGSSPPNVLPVWNPSSPYHSNPASARKPARGFWFETVNGLRTQEYKTAMEWRATNAGGIFAQPLVGKTVAGNSIEASYPAVARGSYRDGGRNSSPNTGFAVAVATPTSGPWSAYHWTVLNEGGRLAVMDLAGNTLTITGYKRDLTQLPVDWTDDKNVEFPNTVLVGTIDTNPVYSFTDFGGGVHDVCWDPRDPYICYISKTIDHCIVKVNFHTQTISGVLYGPSNPLCQLFAGYEKGQAHDRIGGYRNGRALDSMTSGVQQNDGALFNGVYSICMMKRTDNSNYPQGTMFVCDNYNGLIRIISAGTLDTNGNQATPSTVTTLVGLVGGTMPPPNAHTDPMLFMNTLQGQTAPISVTSITLSGATATITLASSPASTIAANRWKIILLNNGSPYYDGNSRVLEHTYGIYSLTSYTSSTQFQIGPIASLPTGTVTVAVPAADIYSSPNPVSFANAYIGYPNTIRMSSKGHLVILEAWYNSMARIAWLRGPNADTITRVGPFGNLAQVMNSGNQVFGWMDVDDAVTCSAGSFTDPGIGSCGPQDDIVLFKVDSNPGSAADNDRWSFDGTFNFLSTYDGNGFFGDGGPDFPSEGPGGTGHYPWGFCFSKTQFRMLSWGLDPLGFFDWRPGLFGDPDTSTDSIGFAQNLTHPYPVVDTGWQLWTMGTRGIFPFGFRPAFAVFGYGGLHFYGQNTAPVLDDLPLLFPNNYRGPAGTVLATYISGGMAGSVPRPEITMDDDGVTPGRQMAALIYFVRRASMSGSWPTQHGPLFVNQNSHDSSGQLVSPGSWSLNYIRPQITVQSGDPARVSNTSIRVRWTTDKNTLGIVCAGTPNSATIPWTGSPALYSLWTTLEMDNSGVYASTHDVTITDLPDKAVTPPSGSNAPNNIGLLVIDKAGNWAYAGPFSVP